MDNVKFLFRKSKNELENTGLDSKKEPNVSAQLLSACPFCKKTNINSELEESLYVCSKCSKNLRISARKRVEITLDEGSFKEYFGDLSSIDILKFPGYVEKLSAALSAQSEKEAVICGIGKIEGAECCFFAMDPLFMMGSMGSVVGEKITRLFEFASQKNLPVIGFTVSGGARMQEGIFSLMQMTKTSAAVKRHSDLKNLYVTVLCDPTTGGVTASFAMLGDIILSEPGALIGFAGPRVIEQTIRQKLPPDFQSAEFLLEKGFVDAIVPRDKMRKTLSTILSLHRNKEVNG